VGLNIKDVDFRRRSIIVTRKGGKVQNLYFNEDVEQALREYIEIERAPLAEKAADDSPLFYSMQKKRLGVKSIENMVKKYAEEAIPLKKITAHKLRASYATELYENSGDLYLTAEALGHSSMNTTKVYANMSESRRRLAPKYIKH
ncbi:MAG: tyrosine-type recombinase/integrase, partial [Lachnospiraceae bacterium]|nr:tyrosine-type recombinase/integrase [Lachnospiraceae bacterium]